MDFDNIKLTDIDSVGTSVQLYPTFGFTEERLVRHNQARAITGKQFTYRTTDARGFAYTVPLTFVNSSDRNQIHDWWDKKTSLRATLSSSDSTPQSVDVKISNRRIPLGIKSSAQFNLWDGILRLQSYKSDPEKPATAFVFILDNSSLGLLDNVNIGLG